jgi:hypothetical protein
VVRVERCVKTDCRCQWKIYLRRFGEFNIVVVIREMNLYHKVSRMESGFYFDIMLVMYASWSLCFLTDGTSSNCILTSYNN